MKLPVRSAPPPPSAPTLAAWRAAQAAGIGAFVALVVGLVARPAVALDLLWNGAVPLLPALFLIGPPIWRNVCPLATLNMVGNEWGDRDTRRRRRPGEFRRWGGVGIAILFLLVPARHLLFNTHGPALAGVVLAVGLFAVLLGLRYANKSGFCNAVCPVLPVERLYGQSPMLSVANPRCRPCVTCSARGCMDRAPEAALEEAMDYPRIGTHWLRTPFGTFAVAFPGFVFGYFQIAQGPNADAGATPGAVAVQAVAVYGTVAAWAGLSWLAGAGLTRLGVPRRLLLRAAAALAIAVYYWYTAGAVRRAWGLGVGAEVGVRLAAALLIGAWLMRAAARDRSPGGVRPSG